MGFFTEMFARPRPQEQIRYRASLALIYAMSRADRAEAGIKPADFFISRPSWKKRDGQNPGSNQKDRHAVET